MTELKTLEDIYNNELGSEITEATKNTLKAEAVKWVKIFEFGTPNGLNPIDSKTKEWIKHFFNLTEEDLK